MSSRPSFGRVRDQRAMRARDNRYRGAWSVEAQLERTELQAIGVTDRYWP